MSNANNGVGHSMSWGGSWLPSVKSGSETMGKGSDRWDWPTRKTSGQAGLGRKESGKRVSTPSGQQKTPQG